MTVVRLSPLLPSIETLRQHLKALALVEAIVSPEWHSRYYSYDANWSTGKENAYFKNGSGDFYNIVFADFGALMIGFDHESVMSPCREDNSYTHWPGVLDTVPVVYKSLLTEPSFMANDNTLAVTACLWRETDDMEWKTGNIEFPRDEDDADGSGHLFWICVKRSPESYVKWAESYYGKGVDIEAVRAIFNQQPLTEEMVHSLNPRVTLANLRGDLDDIKY